MLKHPSKAFERERKCTAAVDVKVKRAEADWKTVETASGFRPNLGIWHFKDIIEGCAARSGGFTSST